MLFESLSPSCKAKPPRRVLLKSKSTLGQAPEVQPLPASPAERNSQNVSATWFNVGAPHGLPRSSSTVFAIARYVVARVTAASSGCFQDTFFSKPGPTPRAFKRSVLVAPAMIVRIESLAVDVKVMKPPDPSVQAEAGRACLTNKWKRLMTRKARLSAGSVTNVGS